MPTCKPNQEINPKTGRCKKKPTQKLPRKQKIAKLCSSKQEINPKTGRCRSQCKIGQERNSDTGRCRKITIVPTGKVGVPQHLIQKSEDCVQLNNWQIVKTTKVGQGAVGSVYVACRENSCDYVAKMQRETKDLQYQRELDILDKLQGVSFIPKVYASFICNNIGYIMMEKLIPLTHESYKKSAKELTNDVANKLEILYDKYKVVFVDIHEGNVMLRQNDEIVLIDFGWAVSFNKTTDTVKEHPLFERPQFKGKELTIKKLKRIQDVNLKDFSLRLNFKWMLLQSPKLI